MTDLHESPIRLPQPETNELGQPVGWPMPDWTPPSRPARQPLDGRLVRLEPLDPARHCDDLFCANAADAEGRLWTYLGYGPFADLESYRAWAEGAAATDDPLFFAILDRAAGRALGVASYLRIDPAAGSIEVGHLCFSPALAGTALATEAMAVMMRHAFALGYRRYEWKCHALNAPSRAAARRLGLGFEGVFKQAMVTKGRNRDTAWYAVTDTLWPHLEAAFVRWLDPANFGPDGRQKLRLSALTRPVYEAGCTVAEPE
jgi:RimJ/RimL family protein N-acetyltransferase